MIAAHPLVGVGPNMVQPLYAQYRDPEAVEKVNPHLHNVPLQIAAERGLPALAIWLWFIVVLLSDLARRFRAGDQRFLAAAALAAVTAMLAAGLVREQLRRLGVPDAVPRSRHAAVRRRTRRLRMSMPAARRRASARTGRLLPRPDGARRRRRHARSVHRRARHPHFSGGAGAGRAIPVRARPAGRRRQRRAQHRRARRPRRAGRHGRGRRRGTELTRLLAAAGVGVDGLIEDSRRRTTEKVRVVTERNQQVARIDYEEDGDIAAAVEQAIVAKSRNSRVRPMRCSSRTT